MAWIECFVDQHTECPFQWCSLPIRPEAASRRAEAPLSRWPGTRQAVEHTTRLPVVTIICRGKMFLMSIVNGNVWEGTWKLGRWGCVTLTTLCTAWAYMRWYSTGSCGISRGLRKTRFRKTKRESPPPRASLWPLRETVVYLDMAAEERLSLNSDKRKIAQGWIATQQ